MHRRHVLSLLAALPLLPMSAVAQDAPGLVPYRPGLVEDLMAQGATVFLDFKATWCSTCAAQDRVMTRLKAENPAYEQHVVFVVVDWDTYGRSQFAQDLRVPRRSTLIAMKDGQELGRLVAQTSEASIRSLMDTALAAATAT